MLGAVSKELKTLLAVGLLFTPALPAYLWLWPVVEGPLAEAAEWIAYAYIIAGTIWIGRRYWRWDELGLKWSGLGLSLLCGLSVIAGRWLIILSMEWNLPVASPTILSMVREIVFYIVLVGFGEELLFRGLVYRALANWCGPGWAIWGTSLGFIFWHIGQGPLIGLVGLIYGLIFGLIRWRSGSINGLILVHGVMDLHGAWLLTGSNSQILAAAQPQNANLPLMLAGLGLLIGTPLWLWLVYPCFKR